MSESAPRPVTRLDGLTVIVTGGARNLGQTYSTEMASRGARVVVADVVDPQPTVEVIRSDGGEAVGCTIDVTEPSSLDAMVHASMTAFGAIDALVNNAGYYRDSLEVGFESIPLEEWERSLSVNVIGTWNACVAVAPTMRAAGRGSIVNVSSETVFKGSADALHYVAAKAAVLGMTRSLATELGPHGIRVNALSPDFVPDPSAPQEEDATHVRTRPLGRRQTPEDLGGAVAFLCSADSAFLTGQTIRVNGGLSYS